MLKVACSGPGVSRTRNLGYESGTTRPLHPPQNCKDYTEESRIMVLQMWWLYYKIVNATTSFRSVSQDPSQSAESLHADNATTINFGYTADMWDRVL